MSLKSMLIQALGGGLLALSALTAQAAPLCIWMCITPARRRCFR